MTKAEKKGLKRTDGKSVCSFGWDEVMQGWVLAAVGRAGWSGEVPPSLALTCCQTIRQGVPDRRATRRDDKSACQPNALQQGGLAFGAARINWQTCAPNRTQRAQIHTEEFMFVDRR